MNKRLLLSLLLGLMMHQLIAQHPDSLLQKVNIAFDQEAAYTTTAYVEKFWRVVGNAGFDSSIYYTAHLLEKAGYLPEDKAKKKDRFTYRIEKYPLKNPAWEPTDANLKIVGEESDLLDFASNRNMLAINSHSTSGTIKAEVVPFNSPNIKGKIVYGEGSLWSMYRTARERGALGVLAYNMPTYTKPEIHQNSIQFGSIAYDKKPLWGVNLSYQANERIKKALAKGKLELEVNIKSKFYVSEELTLVAEIKGKVAPDERFVYSAHVQEPGANDNASGVGVLAEMACTALTLVKTKQVNPARTLTFIWGNEIVSTRRYIQSDAKRAEGIMWGLSLDMVGEDTEKTGGTFLIEKMPDPSAIWTRGNDKHTEWGAGSVSENDFIPHYFTDLAHQICLTRAANTDWRVETNPFEGGSDHTPFLKANIPGLLFWHFTDVFYHTDNDRLDKVSKASLQRVGSSALVLGLFLTADDAEVGEFTLKTIGMAAQKRFATELAISKENLQKGGNLPKEKKILTAWIDWYVKAINATKELSLSKHNEAFLKKIEQVATQFEKGAMKQVKAL